MKKIILIISLFLLLSGGILSQAQNRIAFEFDKQYGIPNGTPITNMENNAEKLLNAINYAAESRSSSIDFTGIGISNDAAYSISLIWENVHMRIVDDDIIEKCTVLKNSRGIRGYEVSNIAVEMIPLNDTYKEPIDQEVTISFDRGGNISDFIISMGMHQYSSFMKGAKTLDDIDQRLQIKQYVEHFRLAYKEKNKDFLEAVFSDDALIITGRVVTRKSADMGILKTVEYTRQNKKEYLNRLFAIFDKPNNYINVVFRDDIEIEHNAKQPNLYGVTLTQEWYSSGYSDVGTVFLLWDFSNPDAPQIYVRTWQPIEDTRRFRVTEFDI